MQPDRAATRNPWVRPDRPVLIAHRGLRARVPEHTTPSLEAAIAAGAEMIEVDARFTRDRVLVLMHDATVDRTTNGTGPIAELTWDEVARLDAGDPADARLANQPVLRVADVMDLAAAAGVALCLEAKGETPEEAADVAVALARLVEDRDAIDWAFVSSFDHAALARARSIVPALLLAPERIPEKGAQPPGLAAEQALGLGAAVIQHRWELIEPDVVEAAHEAGVGIWAWNTNDVASVEHTFDLGVDGIVSDDVTLLVAARDARTTRDSREGPAR